MSLQDELRDEIVARIVAAHPGAEVEMVDLTGGGDHWSASIIAPSFEGMGRLARQRSIYGAMGELMAGASAPIHALTLKTQTPAEAGRE